MQCPVEKVIMVIFCGGRYILISCDQNANQIKQLCKGEFKVKVSKA